MAYGCRFYKRKFNTLKNIKFKKAIKHPKWNMGYKNSIDSATLVNKCLELIEAHYLFDIPFNKMEILIHPEALVHSIVEFDNYVTQFNLFQNDMSIPILNFLSQSKIKYKYNDKKYFINFLSIHLSSRKISFSDISNFIIFDIMKNHYLQLIKLGSCARNYDLTFL